MGVTSSAAALPLPPSAVAVVATAAARRRPPLGAALAALGSLCRRSRSSAVSPGGTSRRYQGAAFVPTPSGLTVAAPPMTWSLIPSFGYGVIDGTPSIRGAVRLVLAEEQRRLRAVRTGADLERVVAELGVARQDRPAVRSRAQLGLGRLRVPRPLVAEPERREDVERGRLRAPVARGDAHQDVGRGRLRVVDLDDPVAVVVEDAGVDQLVFGLELGPRRVGLDQVLVRERGLRVVVAPAQPGAARDRVEVPPVLLDVLAVVALGAGQPEHPLLEDRVLAVPQGQRERQAVEDVGHPRHPVLVPAVRARAGVVVRERAPRVAAGGVVLADAAPGALGEVRPPLVPRARLAPAVLRVAGVLHPLALGVRHVRPPARCVPSARRAARTTTERGLDAVGRSADLGAASRCRGRCRRGESRLVSTIRRQPSALGVRATGSSNSSGSQ